MRVLDGTERKLCCHRAAAHNGVVRQRFDSLFNSVTHRDLSVLGMVGISLRRRRLLRAGPRCPISLGKPWANERALEGRRPPRPCFFWLRGLDLNQRPLGYEYKTAMTGNPLIFRESMLRCQVRRCLLVRHSSSRFALFRGVVGAKWQQIVRVASDTSHC